MSKPLKDELEAALAELRAQQARIREAGDRMKQIAGTASSTDRMITASVDGQGRLVELKLNGTRYRQLAPRDLASRLAGTIRAAQEHAARDAMTAFAGLLPGSMSGTFDRAFDIDAMFESAVSAAREPLFADEVSDEKGTDNA